MTMLDRIAKVIEEWVGYEDELIDWREPARLVLEAMREPTGKMIKAGDQEIPDNVGYRNDACSVYRAMIDAALSGG